jgi:hypothetical protein
VDLKVEKFTPEEEAAMTRTRHEGEVEAREKARRDRAEAQRLENARREKTLEQSHQQARKIADILPRNEDKGVSRLLEALCCLQVSRVMQVLELISTDARYRRYVLAAEISKDELNQQVEEAFKHFNTEERIRIRAMFDNLRIPLATTMAENGTQPTLPIAL